MNKALTILTKLLRLCGAELYIKGHTPTKWINANELRVVDQVRLCGMGIDMKHLTGDYEIEIVEL